MRPKKWNRRLFEPDSTGEEEFMEEFEDGLDFEDSLFPSTLAELIALRMDGELLGDDYPLTNQEILVLKKAGSQQIMNIFEKLFRLLEKSTGEPMALPPEVPLPATNHVNEEIAKEFSKLAAKVLNELDKISKKLDELVKKL